MALSQQTMEDAIWDVYAPALLAVASIPNASVIWSYQSNVLPSRPCATLTWVTRDEVIGAPARDEIYATRSTGVTQAIVHRRLHQVQLDVFAKVPKTGATAGTQAVAILGEVTRRLQTIASRATFAAGGLALRSVSPVQDLTQIVETAYETRASVDLTFATVDQTTENAGEIVTVTAPTGTWTGV